MSKLTSTRRMSDVWDRGLRLHEKEILAELAGLDDSVAQSAWSDLTETQALRLYHAFRAATDLGEVARYALGYTRTR